MRAWIYKPSNPTQGQAKYKQVYVLWGDSIMLFTGSAGDPCESALAERNMEYLEEVGNVARVDL